MREQKRGPLLLFHNTLISWIVFHRQFGGGGGCVQGWANLDQAHEDLDRNIFRDLSPTPKP
jgi:hypothetical protein